MVPDVVATLDGQNPGCVMRTACVHCMSNLYQTKEVLFRGLFCMGENACVSAGWVTAACLLSLIVQNVCKYVVYVCGGRVYLSPVISSAVQVYFRKPCVCVHGQPPWKWLSAREFVCTCKCVHVGERAELCWPLCCGLKRQPSHCVCRFPL